MFDKVNIELDSNFLKRFFELTNKKVPEEQELTLDILTKQLNEISDVIAKLKSCNTMSQQSSINTNSFDIEPDDSDESHNPNNVLIIDDLGVITYQLAVLFKQIGYECTTSKEIYDAIDKFKKERFSLVIMDLFIPTEREGFILFEELKKIAETKSQTTRIGIMSASAKKEHKQLCRSKGAEFYIEKNDDWQKNLFEAIGVTNL
jgi:CheY-like chemotaxis protein